MEYNNSYSEYQQNENSNSSRKTPNGLIVLCILTFIGSGFMLLIYLTSFFMYDTLPEMMVTIGTSMEETLAQKYEEMAELFRQMPQYFFFLMSISYLASIIGSGCMIAMRKIGFHLYIVGQILLLGFPIIIIKNGFDLFGTLLSIAFIALYGSYLKKMR